MCWAMVIASSIFCLIGGWAFGQWITHCMWAKRAETGFWMDWNDRKFQVIEKTNKDPTEHWRML